MFNDTLELLEAHLLFVLTTIVNQGCKSLQFE